MLKVGYFRPLADEPRSYETALRSLGCQVVRVEAQPPDTLRNILEFIGSGDQLVVPSLRHVGGSNRAVLELIERLDRVGASLMVAEPPLVSTGVEGHALRAALSAVSALESAEQRQGQPSLGDRIRQLHGQGVSQTEIARRLQVSRMTVWRRLRDPSSER